MSITGIIQTKPGLMLRKVGNGYMIVEVSDGDANMSNVYSLNATAARMWELAEAGGATAETLAATLADEYGMALDTVRADVERQLDDWRGFGLIL